MELIRGYRYKIYPTVEQATLLSNHCFNANQAFNIMISLNRNQFKHNKDRITLNKNLSVYSQELLSQQRQYLKAVHEDDIIQTILRNRKLDINTKVLQQTRMLFNKDLQKKLNNIETLRKNHYDKETQKQLDNKDYTIKKFELFNFKKVVY